MTELGKQTFVETINRLRKEKNVVILAHNYQDLQVQKLADFTGDSLELAQKAATLEAEIILFCGVRFMAETAKLLNPRAKVLLSHPEAGCPMAEMITAKDIVKLREENPGSLVMCYVNSSAEVKAESDVCCTSSNAVKIARSLPPGKKIIFVPDKNLGSYVRMQTGRDITVWDGFCIVHHNGISLKHIELARKTHPDYRILVHPECRPEVFTKADLVASTKGMADYVATHDKIILGTEIGLYEALNDKYPTKKLLPLSNKAVCGNMKRTGVKDIMLALLEEKNEIVFDEQVAAKALKSLQKMLELS